MPVLGVLVAHTDLHRADEGLFRAINGLGPGPELLWTALDPHTRNYLLLIVLAVVAGAVSTSAASRASSRASSARRSSRGVCSRPSTRSTTAPRPEEVLEPADR